MWEFRCLNEWVQPGLLPLPLQMCVDTAAQRADENLQGPPNEQTLWLTSLPESLEYIFEHPTR